MSTPRYSVNQHPIQTILTWIESGEIAIPEIQRPFVWNTTQVRDLLDSLHKGYPVGYLIAWKNPSVRLKDGSTSEGKRVLIDGQQRVTALMAAVLGKKIIDKHYRRHRIEIAYHPLERRFEVANPAIRKDKAWIADIATVFEHDFKTHRFVSKYCELNEAADEDDVFESIDALKGIVGNQLGLIELNADLDIETVTEIFIRINAKGAVLSQADFAMSKIASNESYAGHTLRKCIDYFCHLAIRPEAYEGIAEHDKDFAATQDFHRMRWLRNENDDLYDPSYTDMLRVAFTSRFRRGRLEDLVALLSGRNFETKTYEENIAEESFSRLKEGIDAFMNETHFKRFVMILRSAGFIDPSLIRSQNAKNFAYVVYLFLRAQGTPATEIESLVRRWFVMSILTGRYTSSPESAFDLDIRRLNEFGAAEQLKRIEDADLSDAFWDFGLPQQFDSPVASSPYFKLFLAAQVHAKDKGFLSKAITVADLITHKGDVHHIFPRNYLKKHGVPRNRYNQVANYVMMQSEINIAVGDKPPADYFSKVLEQVNGGPGSFGGISEISELHENLASNCIPTNLHEFSLETYDDFLSQRRKLMAAKVRDFYKAL